MRSHHPVTPGGATPISDAFLAKRGKPRGSYNCGRCGLPKKGHTCHVPPHVTPDDSTSSATSLLTSPHLSTIRRYPRPPPTQPRRALSFDDIDIQDTPDSSSDGEDEDEYMDPEIGSGRFPSNCLWEVLKRLPPTSLLSTAKVCKGWRDTSRKIWRVAEELSLRVQAMAQVGFIGSILQKCPPLVRLTLTMEMLRVSAKP